jgi:hypothetical protein
MGDATMKDNNPVSQTTPARETDPEVLWDANTALVEEAVELVHEVTRLKDAVLRFVNVDCHDAETIRFLQIANRSLVRGHRNSA